MEIRDLPSVFLVLGIGYLIFITHGLDVASGEAWTTLYFTDEPEQIKAFEPFEVSFVVENHEGTVMDYEYVVDVQFYNNDTLEYEKVMWVGNIHLSPDEEGNRWLNVTINDLYPHRVKVMVRLLKEGETYREIYFWKRPT